MIEYKHSVSLDVSKCKGCTHCLQRCPTEAIRVRDGSAAISNSTCVGGVLTLAPDRVDIADGKLEVMLVRAPKNLTEVGELITALQKQTYNCTMMTFLSAERMTVIADEDMAWTLDGERQEGVGQVEVGCVHNAVQVMRRRDPA